MNGIINNGKVYEVVEGASCEECDFDKDTIDCSDWCVLCHPWQWLADRYAESMRPSCIYEDEVSAYRNQALGFLRWLHEQECLLVPYARIQEEWSAVLEGRDISEAFSNLFCTWIDEKKQRKEDMI